MARRRIGDPLVPVIGSLLLDLIAVGSWALVGFLLTGWSGAIISAIAAVLAMHGLRIGPHIVVLWSGDRNPIEVTAVASVVLLYLWAGGRLLPPPEASTTATIARVVDGDTVVLENGERVRLYGVDAPESRQEWGRKATECLRRLVAGRIVRIEPVERDVYGRLVAKLYTGDWDIGAALVAAGCAWARGPDYTRQEAVARAEMRGLWASPHPIPPWRWRRMH